MSRTRGTEREDGDRERIDDRENRKREQTVRYRNTGGIDRRQSEGQRNTTIDDIKDYLETRMGERKDRKH